MTTDDYIKLILSVVGLVITAVTLYIGPVLKQLLTRNLGVATATLLMNMADTAVRAIEQKHKDQPGDIKKDFALAVLDGLLAGQKITNLNDQSKEAVLESAVQVMNENKLLGPQPPTIPRSAQISESAG